MPRLPGRRNADFENTRRALVERIVARLQKPDGPAVSFREMASAADVSLSTLRHYFTDRAGVLRAALEHQHHVGQPFLMDIASGDLPPLGESVAWFLALFAEGMRSGVSRTLLVGIANGMADAEVGRACLSELLEPTVRALEVRLARHVARGDMRPCDVRHASLTLLGPLVLGYVHQSELDGRTYRPLDLAAFIEDQSATFVRAYGANVTHATMA